MAGCGCKRGPCAICKTCKQCGDLNFDKGNEEALNACQHGKKRKKNYVNGIIATTTKSPRNKVKKSKAEVQQTEMLLQILQRQMQMQQELQDVKNTTTELYKLISEQLSLPSRPSEPI
eukprot:Pgem_evm1s9617